MSQNTEQNVRTRDEQVQWMGRCIKASGDHPSLEGFLREHIRIAEARGAAEERAKAAEGNEVYMWRPHDSGPWYDCLQDRASQEMHTRTLYTRPANVAALEARIKDLAGALKEAASALEQVKDGERGGYRSRNGKFVQLQMSDGERADIIHSEVTAECEGALETARAALTREGGV